MITPTFVKAGHAIFTVDNGKGSHYTYRVTRKDPDPGSKFTSPVWFVSLLTGPDNTSDYTYLGMLQFSGQAIGVKLTKASKYGAEAQPVKVLDWALSIVTGLRALPEGYGIRHEGHCGRCGRLLTVPSSIDLGIGPDCAAQMGIGG